MVKFRDIIENPRVEVPSVRRPSYQPQTRTVAMIVFGYSDAAVQLDDNLLLWLMEGKFAAHKTWLARQNATVAVHLMCVDNMFRQREDLPHRHRYGRNKLEGRVGNASILVGQNPRAPIRKRVTYKTVDEVFEAIEHVGVFGGGNPYLTPIRPPTEADVAAVLMLLGDPT